MRSRMGAILQSPQLSKLRLCSEIPAAFFPVLASLLWFLLVRFPCSSADALEIGIGIGIGGGYPPSKPAPESQPQPSCQPPPPSPPPCSPPPRPPEPHPPTPQHLPPPPPPRPRELTPADFPNKFLYRSYIVIQQFKKTITSDPKNIISTWHGADLSKYKGFFLDSLPCYKNHTPAVASADFNGFRLGAPTIAGFIDGLTELALFHANSNRFSGTVPDLTHLPYLYELDLSNNKLSGSFPVNVLSLKNLTILDLRFNFFSGVAPETVFYLPLDILFLNNNNFGQPLPETLGRTTAAYLTLANNGFTGPIPASIGAAENTLIEVLFLNNSLSGCMPPEIGKLRKATVFDAGFNEITGPIPRTFGCLRKVEQLNFAGNLLYGEVPGEVCRLGSCYGGRLSNLSLSDNYFTSIGSGCLNLLRRGVLDVRKNCIPGFPGQRSAAECSRFFARRKYCPEISYCPCYGGHQGDGRDWTSSPAVRRSPVYASYSGLGR